MKSSKGFTIVELMLALSIGLLIIGVAYTVYFTSFKGLSRAYDAFDNQADIRNAIEITNNSIRFSTVGFAVSQIDYQPKIDAENHVTGLVEPWDYIGLSPDKTKLYHYVYVADSSSSGHYNAETLVAGKEGVEYDLKFDKVESSDSDKMLRYIFTITKNGKEQAKFATEVEALNALQVVDWGDAKNPAIALAYRTEKTPVIGEGKDSAVAAVSVVLDTSGSMEWGLDGEGTWITNINGSNPERLELLKNTLNNSGDGLLNILEDTNSFVSLVPFSYNANMPHANYSGIYSMDVTKFYKVSSERDTLERLINSLSAYGATNTGDGMRRAYSQLLNFEANKGTYGIEDGQEIRNFMIVLIDGVTTAASANIDVRTYWRWGSAYRYEGAFKSFIDLPSQQIGNEFFTSQMPTMGYNTYQLVPSVYSGSTWQAAIGHGAELDTEYGEAYVQRIGRLIQESEKVDQCFVIGYSNYIENGVYTELESVANVAASLGITVGEDEASEQFINNDYVFIATDKTSLRDAFDSIGELISDDLWQVDGPKLNR